MQRNFNSAHPPNGPRISRRPQNRCRQTLTPIRLSLNPKPLHHR